MGEHNLKCAALVGSRICHDLISPIGAINNGIELLAMSGAPPSPEMELIAQSVTAANARIRFFRIAYGAPSEMQMIGVREISNLLRDISYEARYTLEWVPPAQLPRSELQLVFLAIQCAEQALPYGGTITVNSKGKGWQIDLRSERLSPDPKLWESFEHDVAAQSDAQPQISAAHVQFLLLPEYAQAKGRTVQMTRSDSLMSLSF